jgi:cell division septum initiation protein DivIVA
VRRSADRRAAGIEGLGSVATTTVHEQVPVMVTSFNPASVLDPTQPTTVTTTGTETVVKTVPDEAARSRAQIEAQDIRRRAEAEARQILGSALTAARLAHGSRVAGALYFDRDDGLTEALVVVRLDALTIEIPFSAIKRRSLLGRGTLTFR